MIGGFDIQSIEDVEVSRKRVFVRVDFNISFKEDATIADDTRILLALPTLKYLLSHNNKIILASHLGRPKGKDLQYSLKPIAKHLQKLLPEYEVILIDDFTSGLGKKQIEEQTDKQIVLLENIRFYEGEKKNDSEFAKKLASLADIFVNDAFGALHRAHASTEGITHFIPSYAGLLVKREIEMMSRIVKNPTSPLVAIIGGAKISTKINLLYSLMKKADFILVGGGLANTFLKAQDIAVGKSLVEDEALPDAKKIFESFENSRCKLLIPEDAIVGNFTDPSIPPSICGNERIPQDLWILDIGPKTRQAWQPILTGAKTICWNGPVGLFEKNEYRKGTDFIYDEIIKNSQAISVVGGGDTLAAIAGKKDSDKITHISTGGGAMLELLEKETLPGIEALRSHSS